MKKIENRSAPLREPIEVKSMRSPSGVIALRL
jgi:hypothetical protein